MEKKTAKERLFMLIQKQADQEGQWADRLADVAAILDTSRRTVQRALRALEREGKITAVNREPGKPTQYQLVGDNEGDVKGSTMSPQQADYQTRNPWAITPVAHPQDVRGDSASLPNANFPPFVLDNFLSGFPYAWSQEKGDTPEMTMNNFLGIPKDIWLKVGICTAIGGIGAWYAKSYSDDPRAPLWGFSVGIASAGLVIYLLDPPFHTTEPPLAASSATKNKAAPRGDHIQRLIDGLARIAVEPSAG